MATAPHVRKLVKDLNKHSLVDSAILSHAAIIVKFRNGIKEWWRMHPTRVGHWYMHDMPKGNPGTTDDEIQIGHEYNLNPLDPGFHDFRKFLMVRRSQYQKAKFVARRLMVHRLIARLQEEGWLELRYPPDKLMSDFIKLKQDRLDRFTWRRSLRIHGCHGSANVHGRFLLEHFTQMGDLGRRTMREAWKDPKALYVAIRELMDHRKNITRTAITRELNHCLNPKRRAGPQFIPPNFYRAIFKRFGIQGAKMADPSPRHGSKAIAAAAEGISYYYGESIFSESAKEMSDFLDVDFEPIDGSRYDFAFLDFDWDQVSVEDACKWKKQADQVLLYVPRAICDEVELDPVDIQEVEVGILRTNEPDYLFLI